MDLLTQESSFIKFDEVYESECIINTGDFARKTYYGIEQNPQYCRFCNKCSPLVTFQTQAHLIPKLLGSKYLLSYFECDNCNSEFKQYDSDLANFIGVLRTVTGISGKSRVPKYKDKDLVIYQSGEKEITFVSPELTKSIQEGHKQIIINAVKPSFRPINVYKCLLKMGLSIIAHNEAENFRSAYEFLLSNKNQNSEGIQVSMNILQVFVPGPSSLKSPVLHLWRRKDNRLEYPEKVVVLHVKNLKFGFYLPLSINDMHLVGKELKMPILQLVMTKEYIDKHGGPIYKIVNLAENKVIQGKDDILILKQYDT